MTLDFHPSICTIPLPMILLALETGRWPLLLLLGGAVGLMLAMMFCGGALVGVISPGRRAVAQWLPIAAVSLVASGLGRSDMAIGIAFGTSVTLLSIGLGLIVLAGPPGEIPGSARRIWAFAPVPALLAFVLGLQGMVGWLDALLPLGQGVLALMLWKSAFGSAEESAADFSSARVDQRWGQIVLAGLLAAVAAFAAVRGAVQLSERDIRYSPSLISATLLTIVLVMPFVTSTAPLAAAGAGWAAITSAVGIVMLNLCVSLPLALLIPGLMKAATSLQVASAATKPTTQLFSAWPAVLYPRTIWRVDAIALIVLSLVLLPISAGRFRLDRNLAGWLIAGYFIYLVAAMVVTARF